MGQNTYNPLATTRLIGPMVDKFYDRLRELREANKKICWWIGYPLTLVLRPMDIPYIYGEAYAARVAGRKEEAPFLEAMEAEGWLPDTCSYARCVAGLSSFVERKVSQGIPAVGEMPSPAFVVMLNPGCSTEMHWVDHLSRRFKVPYFYIHVPYNWSGTEEEFQENSLTVAKQLKECVIFLEDLTEKSYNWDGLSNLIAYMKKVTLIRKQAMELCAARPAPASLFDWSISLAALTTLQGYPGLDEYFSRAKSEIEERIKNKIGTIAEERYRLYWDGIMVWPYIGHLARKFANLGASVVASKYTHHGFLNRPEELDPKYPMESLAKNIMSLHFTQNLDVYIEIVAGLCKKYHIDGIVAPTTRTCRPFNMFQLQMLQELSWRYGIPGVAIETDMADPSFYTDAQVDTRLQAFVEMIADRKGLPSAQSGWR